MMQDTKILTVLSMALFSKHTYSQPLTFAGGADMSTLIKPSEVNKSLTDRQNVTLRGEVTDVCRKLGCWMKLAVTSELELIVNTEEGNMVFPVNAIGRIAYVTGLLQKQAEHKSLAFSLTDDAKKEQAWLFPLSVTISEFSLLK